MKPNKSLLKSKQPRSQPEVPERLANAEALMAIEGVLGLGQSGENWVVYLADPGVARRIPQTLDGRPVLT
ncbi:MAG: hypothetical protein ACPGJE_00225, partial [Wenzhouxiangellaceae bacterium]